MLRRDAQRAVGKSPLVSVQLLEVRRHCFSGRLKKPAQFRLDVKFPFRTALFLALAGRPAEEALLSRRTSLRACAGRYLSKKFGQKWIELRYLELVFPPANFHINRFSRAWQAVGIRAIAGRRARRVRGRRSTKLSDLFDALPACGAPLFRADNQTRVGKPSSRKSSDSPDRCAPPPARGDPARLGFPFPFQSSDPPMRRASESLPRPPSLQFVRLSPPLPCPSVADTSCETLTYGVLSSIAGCLGQDAPLCAFHLSPRNFGSVIKPVQMEETMRDVQLKLARQCVSKLSCVTARRLRADENFTR